MSSYRPSDVIPQPEILVEKIDEEPQPIQDNNDQMDVDSLIRYATFDLISEKIKPRAATIDMIQMRSDKPEFESVANESLSEASQHE